MSYDISLKIDTGGYEPADLGFDWSHRDSCAPMWRAAGVDVAEFDGRLAGDCYAELVAAVATLKSESWRFVRMNPTGGGCSFQSLVPELDKLAGAFARHPKATVRVSR